MSIERSACTEENADWNATILAEKLLIDFIRTSAGRIETEDGFHFINIQNHPEMFRIVQVVRAFGLLFPNEKYGITKRFEQYALFWSSTSQAERMVD